MAPAHLVRVCGSNHGLLEWIPIITDVQTDVTLRVCLLSKDVMAKKLKVIMPAKSRVKLTESAVVERSTLCQQGHSEVVP